MTYDPTTLKNTRAYLHEVEAARAEELKFLPKKTSNKEDVKKPTNAALSALVEKFKKS